MRSAFLVVAVIGIASIPVASQQIQEHPGRAAPLLEAPTLRERGRTFFDDVDGTLWARGDDFKASFSGDAMSFIPFLGADAPRNFPVTFRVESVRNGAQALDLAKPERALRHGDQIAIDRGAVVELYTVAPTHVEQLFRFEKSAGAGDLTVRLAVETELGVSRTGDGALEFANDRGGVRYGRPEVVDATGRKAAMESSWHDGAIELTVPEAFLAEASFPVTIDPTLLTLGFVSGGPFSQDFKPDVAYDLASDLYAMVYEEVYSATDHDVVVRTINTLGATVATDYIDFTTSFWAAPKVANNRIAAQFLAVAEKTLSGGAVVIFGRTLQPTNPIAMGAQFQISGAELGFKSHPDVGGDPSPYSPTYYCVCWQSTINGAANIHYNLVQANQAFVFSTNPSPWAGYSTANTNSKPSISKSDGNGNSGTQNWVVVFQSKYSPTDEDIYGAIINWDGTLLHTGFPIDTSGLYEQNPSVSSVTDEVNGTRRWLTVYEQLNPGVFPFSSPNYDIHGRLFSGLATLITTANLTNLFGTYANADQTHPCVDSDGTRFTIGFTESGGFVDQGIPYLATLHVNYGATLGVTEFPVSVNAYVGPDDNMRVTSKRSGGGVQYRYMAVHDVHSVTNGIIEVQAALYDGWSAAAGGAYVNTTSPGCGGLSISVTGFPALGLGMNASLSGVQGTGFFLIGQPISPLALCSGCLLGVDPSTVMIIQGVNLTSTIPVEGGLVNAGVAIQGADIGSSTGCAGSPSFSLSETVVVTIL